MLLRFVLSALAVVAATPVAAQLAANLEVDTDNRFRGVSLSGGKPSLRAGVSYDDASGFYTGMSATDVELDSRRRRAALRGPR